MRDTIESMDLDAHLRSIAAGLEFVAARRLANRDDALEATQETLARLIQSVRAGRIATPSELTPIAYGIARHIIADIVRRRVREHAVTTDTESGASHPLDLLVHEEECAQVRSALRRLSESDRALLRRCFVHGESIGKIAQSLGEPAERMRKRKSRALQRLADMINGRSRTDRHEVRAVAIEQV